MVKITKRELNTYNVEIQGTSNVVANELTNGLFHFMQIMYDMDVECDTIINVIEQITKVAITKFDLYSTTKDIDL